MSAPGWGRCASHTGQVFSLVTQLIAFLTTRPVSVRLRGVASASSLPGHVKAPAEAPGRTSLQHRKDEFLLPHGTGVFDLVLFRKLHEHGHAHVLQFSKAHRCAFLNLLRGNFLLPHTFRYLFWE